ncbi:MAG: hypothetical protein HYT12_01850 [Candidatus Liptonbacteria bacterium]|nr:hypothetical protein [Candidatus Liptonbacteria bacterium]
MIKHEVVNGFEDVRHLKAVIITEPPWIFPELYGIVQNSDKSPRFSDVLAKLEIKPLEFIELIDDKFNGRPHYKLQIGITAVGHKLAIIAC